MYPTNVKSKNIETAALATMSDIKYMVKSKKLKRNWTRRENFDICFCVSFNHSRQKIIFGGKTGNQPVSPHNFGIFFSWLNFL